MHVNAWGKLFCGRGRIHPVGSKKFTATKTAIIVHALLPNSPDTLDWQTEITHSVTSPYWFWCTTTGRSIKGLFTTLTWTTNPSSTSTADIIWAIKTMIITSPVELVWRSWPWRLWLHTVQWIGLSFSVVWCLWLAVLWTLTTRAQDVALESVNWFIWVLKSVLVNSSITWWAVTSPTSGMSWWSSSSPLPCYSTSSHSCNCSPVAGAVWSPQTNASLAVFDKDFMFFSRPSWHITQKFYHSSRKYEMNASNLQTVSMGGQRFTTQWAVTSFTGIRWWMKIETKRKDVTLHWLLSA